MSKRFECKVYDASGNYLKTWTDVISVPSYSQEINAPAVEQVIRLGRSPDDFGEEDDVKFKNIVKIYIKDLESNNELFFQGYITDYTPIYGENQGVEVILFSFGAELDGHILVVDEQAEQNQATGSSTETFGGGKSIAQSFIPTQATLTTVEVKLSSATVQTAQLSIQTDSAGVPSGTAVANGTASKEITDTTAAVVRFIFSTPPTLSLATTYWIVLST